MIAEFLSENYREYLCKFLEEHSSLGILLLDENFYILKCNKGFSKLISTDNSLEGSLLSDYLPEESKEELRVNLENGIGEFKLSVRSPEGSLHLANVYCFFVDKNYLMFWEIKPLSGSEIIEEFSVLNNELTNTVRELNKKNIELKKANETINRLLRVDPLTNIYNRRYFIEELEKSFSLFKRHGIPLSLVMADLDDFKKINDKWGHDIGDKVLISFAKKLQEMSREEDIAARIGGEEFMVLMPNTNYENAKKFAERVREFWSNQTIPPIDFFLSASFGVTGLWQNDSVDTVMIRVDNALYQAKRKGKNCVEGINESV